MRKSLERRSLHAPQRMQKRTVPAYAGERVCTATALSRQTASLSLTMVLADCMHATHRQRSPRSKTARCALTIGRKAGAMSLEATEEASASRIACFPEVRHLQAAKRPTKSPNALMSPHVVCLSLTKSRSTGCKRAPVFAPWSAIALPPRFHMSSLSPPHELKDVCAFTFPRSKRDGPSISPSMERTQRKTFR